MQLTSVRYFCLKGVIHMKKYKRRVSAFLSATLLATAVLAGVPCTGKIAYADEPFVKTAENTGLGTGGIINPYRPTGGLSDWIGSFVYYGHYGMNNDGTADPTKYRVLDKSATEFNGDTLFLDCDSILYRCNFNSSNSIPNPGAHAVNEWAYSDVQKSLNGDDFLEKEGVFSQAEKDAIVSSTVAEHELILADYDGSYPIYEEGKVTEMTHSTFQNYVSLSNDKVFLLDAEDMSNIKYGYSMEDHLCVNRRKNKSSNAQDVTAYWLRSAAAENNNVGYINHSDITEKGQVHCDPVNMTGKVGASPAFNVNLKSVLFTSLIKGSLEEFGAEYKLTLYGGKDYSAKITDRQKIKRDDKNITIPFTASFGDDNGTKTISVIMTDGEYKDYPDNTAEIKYYGKLDVKGEVGESGIGTFILPDGYDNSWNTYILAEKVNGKKETDYAGKPELIEIPCAITFDPNEGEGEMPIQIFKKGTAINLNNNEFTREGYTFGFWNAEKDGTGEYYLDKEMVIPDGDMTLFAQWIEIPKSEPEPEPNIPKALSEKDKAIEAHKKCFMSSGDTVKLDSEGKKYILETISNCQLTVVKGNKLFIKDVDGQAMYEKKNKNKLSINKKGKVTAKKAADNILFQFKHKKTEKMIAVSINIIEPAIEGGKKLKAKAKAGEAFDFSTTIPLNSDFKTVKNDGVAENLTYEGEAAIGEDGKLHIKGTALKKGKVTIPFTVYGKKFKAIIQVN